MTSLVFVTQLIDPEDPALGFVCGSIAALAEVFDRLDVIWPRLGASKPTEVAVAGGVAANGTLRARMVACGAACGVTVRLPENRYCTDNAAMIAFAALQKPDGAVDPRRVTARSRIA